MTDSGEPPDPWASRIDFGPSFKTHAHFVFATVTLGAAGTLLGWTVNNPRSTYMCPSSSDSVALIPALQLLGIGIDCYLVLKVGALLDLSSSDGAVDQESPVLVLGSVLVVSIVSIPLLGSNSLINSGRVSYADYGRRRCLGYTHTVLDLGLEYRSAIHSQLGGSDGLVQHCCYCNCADCKLKNRNSYQLREIDSYQMSNSRPLHVAVLVTFTCIFIPALHSTWLARDTLPSISCTRVIIFLGLLLLGFGSYLKTASHSGGFETWKLSNRFGPRITYLIFSCLCLLTLLLGCSRSFGPQIISTHPIDSLLHDAIAQSATWLEQASRSGNLDQAVDLYQQRYRRAPPPGFDAWYRYAKKRSAVVIDDYDSMYDDLLPFWGLPPTDIRHRTQRVISDPWNDVAEIVIRNGRAQVGPNNKPTHRWMVEGFVTMMEGFVDFLPDMDLALNLNDEPRVAVPYNAMQKLVVHATPSELHDAKIRHGWSPDRAKAWKDEGAVSSRPFGSYPRINSFSAATAACPPSSAVQKAYLWDPRPLCLSCAAPHSRGNFLSDWPLSASPCHQPDLRNLHGLYLSPAAFKTSHELLPIFSQSKVEGFADILYPSPGNYIHRERYFPDNDTNPDPSFAEKENSFFWRGATSEGVSRDGTWKGMTRQRLVQLASNRSHNSRSPTLPILLPHPDRDGKYSYQLPADPISVLDTTLNVSFVTIDRALDSDGPAQTAEFNLAQPTDFQAHWRHRYLIDMDGAGFSGRFLPFLQSKSLPFRTGIFRTWYDSRLTAWAHFIPIDIRLHGLFSTLAYFTGTKGQEGAKTLKGRVGMEMRMLAGEAIAERGREWAGKVLRKEDMEIYLFRLLLEWGRITDDHRDEIGYVRETGG